MANRDGLNPEHMGPRPHGMDSGWCKTGDHEHCMFGGCTCICHEEEEEP